MKKQDLTSFLLSKKQKIKQSSFFDQEVMTKKEKLLKIQVKQQKHKNKIFEQYIDF